MNMETGYRDLPVSIPCGQCMGCRIDRASAWTTRILHEAQTTEEEGKGSSFITLTYDQENVPKDYGLNVQDWQKFAKRMRKELGPFRFFHCGEYGDDYLRPHYHAIIFGIDFTEDRIPFAKNKYDQTRYISETLTKLWGKGNAELGTVEKQSAAYVAKYCLKKATGDTAPEIYKRTQNGQEWQVKSEYATMSLKPGIGAKWFSKYGQDIYPSDKTIINGSRVKTPKYYDGLLKKGYEEGFLAVKSDRAKAARLRKADNTTERREAKEYTLRQAAERRGKGGI